MQPESSSESRWYTIKGHFIRAIMESLGYLVRRNMDALSAMESKWMKSVLSVADQESGMESNQSRYPAENDLCDQQ